MTGWGLAVPEPPGSVGDRAPVLPSGILIPSGLQLGGSLWDPTKYLLILAYSLELPAATSERSWESPGEGDEAGQWQREPKRHPQAGAA